MKPQLSPRSNIGCANINSFCRRLFSTMTSNLRFNILNTVLACVTVSFFSLHAAASEINEFLNSENRLEADLERDKRSKPELIVPLLNLAPGDSVVDIFGSGGYYSEILAAIVGSSGEAILHNNSGFEAWGVNGLKDRFTDRDPGNIRRHTTSGINLDLQPDSLDGALIVMAFHDLFVIPKRYNGEKYVATGRAADTDYFLKQVYESLKSGGRFVVIDHNGDPALSQEETGDLHRIEENFAKEEVIKAGFNFIESFDALRNPNDDLKRIVFDSDLKGKTDRFVLVFEKP